MSHGEVLELEKKWRQDTKIEIEVPPSFATGEMNTDGSELKEVLCCSCHNWIEIPDNIEILSLNKKWVCKNATWELSFECKPKIFALDWTKLRTKEQIIADKLFEKHGIIKQRHPTSK